jgi:hypothetical protein
MTRLTDAQLEALRDGEPFRMLNNQQLNGTTMTAYMAGEALKGRAAMTELLEARLEARAALAAKDAGCCRMLEHVNDDGTIGGHSVVMVSGGADYVGAFPDGYPRRLSLAPIGRKGSATYYHESVLADLKTMYEAAFAQVEFQKAEIDRLTRQRDEARAYLKAFVYATIDPNDKRADAQLHKANPSMGWLFILDDTEEGGRQILSSQVRRAMEIVGYDKLKIDPPGTTVADDLVEANRAKYAANARVAELEGALACEKAERELLQDVLDSRPAINAGLPETYIRWSGAIYAGDFTRAALGRDAT